MYKKEAVTAVTDIGMVQAAERQEMEALLLHAKH